uniref:Uncharacterized protein n=1 Tax=Panagrolaimus davidi TaxID=227884 RepID=A0A914Q350_9BILA
MFFYPCTSFSGTYLLEEAAPEVVSLNSMTGNIHSIESVDGVGAFFDLLIPGYDQIDGNMPCTYYQCDIQNPTVGKIYWLRIIPETTLMGELNLPVINDLD